MDLTRGIYRLVYSGALTGRRINAVSRDAEWLFWRLHMIADDYGNAPAEPRIVRALACPLRDDVTADEVTAWLDELDTMDLIVRYWAGGERYLSIVDFTRLQPKNRSGRRIRRFPGNPGESGGIQGNPGESCAPESESESESDTHTDDKSESESESEQNAAKPISGSDSRQRAWLAFQSHALPLMDRGGGRQELADRQCLRNWFEELWPERIRGPTVGRREDLVRQFGALCRQAAQRSRPMAWLTKMWSKANGDGDEDEQA